MGLGLFLPRIRHKAWHDTVPIGWWHLTAAGELLHRPRLGRHGGNPDVQR